MARGQIWQNLPKLLRFMALFPSLNVAVQLLQRNFPKIVAQLLFSLVACCRRGRGLGLADLRQLITTSRSDELPSHRKIGQVCELCSGARV